MTSEPNHPCPCCGYRTYLLPAGWTMQLCPVCFWEDSLGSHLFSNSNQVSLVEGQRNFIACGACERRFHDAVRTPLPHEDRSPHWLSADDFRSKLILFIEEAFANVSLDDGVTLHQMDALDDFWGEENAMREAALKDTEKSWQEISFEKVERFSGSMVFLDAKGFRFHLPAFMRLALVTAHPDVDRARDEGVMFALQGGPADRYYGEYIGLMDEAQKQCAAAFLHFFARYSNEFEARDAAKGLQTGWQEFTPEFVRLSNI